VAPDSNCCTYGYVLSHSIAPESLEALIELQAQIEEDLSPYGHAASIHPVNVLNSTRLVTQF
jgi:hypothetical protein